MVLEDIDMDIEYGTARCGVGTVFGIPLSLCFTNKPTPMRRVLAWMHVNCTGRVDSIVVRSHSRLYAECSGGEATFFGVYV